VKSSGEHFPRLFPLFAAAPAAEVRSTAATSPGRPRPSPDLPAGPAVPLTPVVAGHPPGRDHGHSAIYVIGRRWLTFCIPGRVVRTVAEGNENPGRRCRHIVIVNPVTERTRGPLARARARGTAIGETA